MRAFVVAMENEAAQVRPVLGGDDLLFVSGVGKVNAAAATQKAIDAGADVVLNCGVAGGLDPLMNVGDVYEIEKAVEYDFDLTMLNGTRIGTHNERDTPFFGCRASGAFPARTLATGDRFTNDERDVSVPLSLGATVKDMEGAAVAHVCEANGVPCRMLKCISDVHGKGVMTGQYKDYLAKALACLRDALTSWT